jgi:hypothetical protein
MGVIWIRQFVPSPSSLRRASVVLYLIAFVLPAACSSALA